MKKAISLLLSLCLFATGFSTIIAEPSANELNEMAIKWDRMSIISKDNWILNQDSPISRSELSVVLNNIMDFQGQSENNFSDTEEEWYLDYMLKTHRADLLVGSNGQLNPYDQITREQAVVVMAKALGLQTTTSQAETGFSDNSLITASAIPYINAMKNEGYLPFKEHFIPQQAITKSEILQILNSSIEEIYSTPKTYSKNISGNLIINSPGVSLTDVTIDGNLILSEGIAQEEVYLKNVIVKGRTIVRGASAVHASNCNLGEVVIADRDGETAVILDESSTSDSLLIANESLDASFTGATSSITLHPENTTLSLINAQTDRVEMAGNDAVLNIDEDTNAKVVNFSGDNSEATIEGVAESVYVGEKANNANITIGEEGDVSFLTKRTDSTVAGEEFIEVVSELPVYEEPVVVPPSTDGSFLGTFKSTAYCTENYHHICNNGNAAVTAMGTAPIPYQTVAVDTSVIPLGTQLKIEDSSGNIYNVTATDTGGAVKGNKIDMVVHTHDDALQWGVRTVKVWKVS